MITWKVSHLEDGTTDYHYRSDDWTREALITGADRNWTWYAAIWNGRGQTILTDHIGEALYLDSAKEDVNRFFKEAER